MQDDTLASDSALPVTALVMAACDGILYGESLALHLPYTGERT